MVQAVLQTVDGAWHGTVRYLGPLPELGIGAQCEVSGQHHDLLLGVVVLFAKTGDNRATSSNSETDRAIASEQQSRIIGGNTNTN